MIQSKSASNSKAYFSEALIKTDYYLQNQELKGFFHGRLAERLGIHGEVTQERFFALCDNRHPHTGETITPNMKDNRTVSYDINMHAPKSVSILHALSKDDHVLVAFRESVHDTMKEIEADSLTRVRMGAQSGDRKSGEILYADFIHQTARPANGQAPDPHLHVHCVTMNTVWDATEQRVKAGQFREIKRNMPYYEAYFHKSLSDRLMALGYDVRKTDKSFEVVGIPQEAIDLFSKRTDQIGRVAKEKGITGVKEKSELGARTRDRKRKDLTMGELKKIWIEQIRKEGLDTIESDQPIRYAMPINRQVLSARNCLDHSFAHHFERASVTRVTSVMGTALRQSIGNPSLSADHLRRQFEEDSRVIKVMENMQELCTTKEVLQEEKAMVALAQQGINTMPPLYSAPPSLSATGQQAMAITHVLTATSQVSIIRGVAGAGKTTLLAELSEKVKESGKQIFVFAPSADASRGTLRKEGHERADTVARLLTDKNLQEQISHQVVFIDEAGLLGTRDTKKLLELTQQYNARLILAGDTRQHAAVVRGDALRILSKIAGIRPAEVNKIYRQQSQEYRQAISELASGKVQGGFERLDRIGFIREVEPEKPHDALIEDYVIAVKKGKSTLIITPTHEQGRRLTDDLREYLKKEKLLGKDEITRERLQSLNLTMAEKQDARTFRAGQTVQFNQHAKGIKRGSIWTVVEAKEGTVTIRDETNRIIYLPLHQSDRYEVFEKRSISVAKGDRIRITRNGQDQNQERLSNGQLLEVISVKKDGEIKLQNAISKCRYTLGKEFQHFTHAHCMTSHASQGRTVDEVFIAQPSATFPASDAKQFYVSASRGRDKATFYTDDRAALLEHVSRLGDRQSAMELVGYHEKHLAYVQQKQRNGYYKPPLQNTKMTTDKAHTVKYKDGQHEPAV